MTSLAALLPLVLILACGAASAADPAPAGRYQLAPSRDGFARIDTRTGAASHCAYDGKTWACESLGEVGSPLAARLDALTAEVATLAATVRRLENEVGRETPSATTAPLSPKQPNFAARAVAPLFDFVRRFKNRGDSA